jgi:hypothetical protein
MLGCCSEDELDVFRPKRVMPKEDLQGIMNGNASFTQTILICVSNELKAFLKVASSGLLSGYLFGVG